MGASPCREVCPCKVGSGPCSKVVIQSSPSLAPAPGQPGPGDVGGTGSCGKWPVVPVDHWSKGISGSPDEWSPRSRASRAATEDPSWQPGSAEKAASPSPPTNATDQRVAELVGTVTALTEEVKMLRRQSLDYGLALGLAEPPPASSEPTAASPAALPPSELPKGAVSPAGSHRSRRPVSREPSPRSPQGSHRSGRRSRPDKEELEEALAMQGVASCPVDFLRPKSSGGEVIGSGRSSSGKLPRPFTSEGCESSPVISLSAEEADLLKRRRATTDGAESSKLLVPPEMRRRSASDADAGEGSTTGSKLLSPGRGRHRSPVRSASEAPAGEASASVSPRASSADRHKKSPKGKHSWRPICHEGAMCKLRTRQHLMSFSHPTDEDYKASCKAAGIEYEPPSLRVLFEWADVDASGKLSVPEIQAATTLLARVSNGSMPEKLTKGAWERLDEDGNGAVNFSEFAEWAGPRLGLPLGADGIFRGDGGAGCGVLGCPCAGYEDDSGKKKRKGHFHGVKLCSRCGHKKLAHYAAGSAVSGSVVTPDYWKNRSGEFTEFVPVPASQLQLLQDLVTSTYSSVWTRDRKKHGGGTVIPRGFRLTKAVRNENSRLWRHYSICHAELSKDAVAAVAPGDGAAGGAFKEVKPPVKTAASAQKLAKLDTACNEWYLFHGTGEAAINSITGKGFKMKLAGEHTGTLYGRGTYFAESVTKADEYGEANSHGQFTMLLCRVLGGRVKYTAESEPDPEALVSACIEGPFDCVLGDREKCAGTYREFVFFDSEGVYPEYVLTYTRVT